MFTHLMKTSTCERTDSTPSADEFYLLSVLVQSQHTLGVNTVRYKTTICDKREQHMDWKPLNRSPMGVNIMETTTTFPNSCTGQELGRVQKLTSPPVARGTLLPVNTCRPSWQRKFSLLLSKLYCYSARTVNPVSFISTEFSLSEKRSTKGRENYIHTSSVSPMLSIKI